MIQVDQTLRELLVEQRLLEGTARIYQARLEMVNASLTDIYVANQTLEGIKGKPKGSETLAPIGAGSFVRTELADTEKIIIGIGAGVAVEKSVDDSIFELKNRQAELERIRTSLQQQLTQVATKLEEDRSRISELVRKKGGETVEVI
jgi:prefoldin alpha subunit